jgi:hypothetical protein
VEHISGFIALDGRFFLSEEECKEHEEDLRESKALQERSEIIISSFKSGVPSPVLPETLANLLGNLTDQEVVDAWNQFLLHLFLDGDANLFYEERAHRTALHQAIEIGGPVRPSTEEEYFMLKVRLAYEVTAFLLGVD